MEDLVPILWVFVAVGAMIYNAVTKAKGKKGGSGPAEPVHREAWPAMEQPADPGRRVVAHSSAPLRKAPERSDAASSRPDSLAAASTARHFSEPEQTENTQQLVEATDDAFDLRRAVIYSELLSPKFDE